MGDLRLVCSPLLDGCKFVCTLVCGIFSGYARETARDERSWADIHGRIRTGTAPISISIPISIHIGRPNDTKATPETSLRDRTDPSLRANWQRILYSIV